MLLYSLGGVICCNNDLCLYSSRGGICYNNDVCSCTHQVVSSAAITTWCLYLSRGGICYNNDVCSCIHQVVSSAAITTVRKQTTILHVGCPQYTHLWTDLRVNIKEISAATQSLLLITGKTFLVHPNYVASSEGQRLREQNTSTHFHRFGVPTHIACEPFVLLPEQPQACCRTLARLHRVPVLARNN